MQWYYAVGSKRHGPMDTITFNGLVTKGAIAPDTLVWRTGMPEWLPWSEVAPSVTDVINSVASNSPPGDEPIVETPWPGQEAEAHDASEGMPMEELWPRIQSHGFNTSISSCLSRAWAGLKLNYWGALGVTLLFVMVALGAQMIPLLGIVAGFVIVPQLTGGVWWYFIRRTRGEEAVVNDLFAGFSRGFGQFALLAFFQFLLFVPIDLAIKSMGITLDPKMAEIDPSMGIPLCVYALIVIYVMTRWQFTHALVIDRGYSAIEAIKLSWRIVGLRFLTIFGLGLVLGCLMMLGFMAFIIGAVFIAPLMFAAMVEAYEDAIRPKR